MKRLFAFALLSVALRHSANAAVIYSGLQNIAIPTDYNGIYINIDNGATSGSTILGWDINPFFGGAGLGNSSAFQPARLASGNLDPILRLNMGDVVGAALTYSTGLGGSGDRVRLGGKDRTTGKVADCQSTVGVAVHAHDTHRECGDPAP